jgi:hypothetical protein
LRFLDRTELQADLSIYLRMVDCNVRIAAPEPVMSVLELTLANVPRYSVSSPADLTIVAKCSDDVWEIDGGAGGRKILTRQSALPQIAGAIVSTAVTETALARNCTILRAAVMERGGRALAMIGDDWESAITVAVHLHDRGWRFLGADNAVLDSATLEVFAIEKSLYVSSSFLSHLPLRYRKAVEASPWYATDRNIAFYAVDPRVGDAPNVWSRSARLAGIIIVDGEEGDQPSLESLDPQALQSERLRRLSIDWDEVNAADLVLGGFVETCDLVEHWFASLRA